MVLKPRQLVLGVGFAWVCKQQLQELQLVAAPGRGVPGLLCDAQCLIVTCVELCCAHCFAMACVEVYCAQCLVVACDVVHHKEHEHNALYGGVYKVRAG